MNVLVGFTGFVGSNLDRQASFQKKYNSKNIDTICGIECDTLVCAGVPAVKWKANRDPEEDWIAITKLITNITQVNCQRCILISTVDVYSQPTMVNEDSFINIDNLHPYGLHRFKLEKVLYETFGKALHIIRLPALFGAGLKKNILYDLICDNQLSAINPDSKFQWYPVERLWQDILMVVKQNIPLINFATEPLATSEIVNSFFSHKKLGDVSGLAMTYDMQTNFSEIMSNRTDGYLMSKEEVMIGLSTWLNSPEITCV